MRLFIGVFWLLCAIICFIKKDKKYGVNIRNMLGAFFIVFGIIGILGFVLKNDILTLTAFVLATALLCIGAAVNLLLHTRMCQTQVSAVYISCNRYSGGKGPESFAPVFQYCYQGRSYKQQTPESFSGKKINNKFQCGQRYDIYINNKAPEFCISQRKISIGDWMVGVLGIAVLIFYIIIIMDAI